jgi:hypothetical protein
MAQKIKRSLTTSLISLFAVLLFSFQFVALNSTTAYAAIDCSVAANKKKIQCNPIVQDINIVVNFLSIGVGVVVIAMIIVGGIQYSLASDNPQAVSAAKQRIINALIALVAYIFMFAFLQWLIPGGIF